jgi:hypothetical protein
MTRPLKPYNNAETEYFYESESMVALPYSDELWEGLQAMKRVIDDAHAKLKALVERKDLADRLRLIAKQGGMPILPEVAGGGVNRPSKRVRA